MRPSPQSASNLPPGPPDEELVRRVVDASDGEAFELLMSRYQARIYSVIMRLVRDQERARDLTQETFMKAWRGLAGFEGGAGFYTWLYRISRNLVTSDWRREKSRPRFTHSVDEAPTEGRATGAAVVPIDRRSDPGDRARARERQRLLLDAIDELVPDFKEILVLRDLEGLAYEEIADMLDLPVGTVRSRLHRARLELKAKIERFWDE